MSKLDELAAKRAERARAAAIPAAPAAALAVEAEVISDSAEDDEW